MDARSIVTRKRDGGELGREEIEHFLRGYVAGEIPDYQAAALLMAIFIRGMGEEELALWTEAMLRTGTVFDFTNVRAPKADKHSTGGVGDKVSIPLAPAVGACGVAVPMISGRGLGHTGGTLDKLESIPGFRTQLSDAEFRGALADVGVALGGQTKDLVPADRKLYALRDVTGLVESIPLIASSILSKKLAEGIDALVLDVKFGSGAFLEEPERGAALARCMLGLARRFGLRASAFQTSMEAPLGRTVGHALEIRESIECLRGEGPADLRELVERLGGEMLRLVGAAESIEDGRARIASALDGGAALEKLREIVSRQGGDPRAIDEPDRLPRTAAVETWNAPSDGSLAYADVRELGRALCALGGGRLALEDRVDPAVGVVCLRRAGEEVRAGEPLFEIHHRDGKGLAAARAHLGKAVRLGERFEPAPLVLAHLEA